MGGDTETARALSAALAISTKLEYYALMAVDLQFISAEAHAPYTAEIVEVKKMLQGFKHSLTHAGEQLS